MQLKTLKEIETRIPKGIEMPCMDWYTKELRAEGIKHYKSNQKHPREEETFRLLHFIKNFFNLTEEELQ